jgi:hypothetical protein
MYIFVPFSFLLIGFVHHSLLPSGRSFMPLSNAIVAQICLATSDLDQLSGINFKNISFAPDAPVPPTNGVTIKAQIIRGKPSHHVQYMSSHPCQAWIMADSGYYGG